VALSQTTPPHRQQSGRRPVHEESAPSGSLVKPRFTSRSAARSPGTQPPAPPPSAASAKKRIAAFMAMASALLQGVQLPICLNYEQIQCCQ